MTTFIQFPQERVYFGEDYSEALSGEVERLGARRVFILASETLCRRTDLVRRAAEELGGNSSGQATGMPPHTPRDAVLDMAKAASDANADLIVTLGGGSLTDAGKMVRLCMEHGIDGVGGFDAYRNIVHADGRIETRHYGAVSIPQITIPTTLSGGEFNISAGCTDQRVQSKQLYRHPSLMPKAVILDPAVTVHTPQWLWLSTGMRAVDHCVETICSHLGNRQSDGAAFNGLRLLVAGLPAVEADPDNLDARLDCLVGAWQSMEHNQSGVPMGASHGIGHVLGGTCGVPHGHTSCIMLPAVLRWNRTANADRQAQVSEIFGRPGEDAATVVEDFVRSLGQPTRLSEVGVLPEQFPEVARHALHDRYLHTNPRAIGSAQDIVEILELAA